MAKASSSTSGASIRTKILDVFERDGFVKITPQILQPADVFLEYSGEVIRSKTFVFSDFSGRDVCLRPDLTLPTCLHHLAHAKVPLQETRYAYCGPIFRCETSQGHGATLGSSDFVNYETEQAGIEWFGSNDPIGSEAHTLHLILSALGACGLFNIDVKIGDLGLFQALLEDLSLPQRWRTRLKNAFPRPHTFQMLLETFSQERTRKQTSLSPLLDVLPSDQMEEVMRFAQDHMEEQGIDFIGKRTLEEITLRLCEKKKDRTAPPLSQDDRTALDAYLSIEGPVAQVLPDLRALSAGKPLLSKALLRFEERLGALQREGISPDSFVFSSTFGNRFEYYTGFVFEVRTRGPSPLALASGGRYDHLLSAIGAKTEIPALGSALSMEHVLEAALDMERAQSSSSEI